LGVLLCGFPEPVAVERHADPEEFNLVLRGEGHESRGPIEVTPLRGKHSQGYGDHAEIQRGDHYPSPEENARPAIRRLECIIIDF
jgi:hypothetical protein